MKNRKRLPIAVALITAITFGILGYFLYSDRPFASLSVDEIEEITVYAIPPEKEVVLSESETEAAVLLLQDLKVSKPGYGRFMFGLAGQTVTLTVQKTDGSVFAVSNIGNVLITIDNMSYQADYESAKAISDLVNKALETDD